MMDVLTDYYRCPEAFGEFEAPARGETPAGFFSFGEGITCYGRLSTGPTARKSSGPLHDCSPEVLMENGKVRLPFQIGEVVDNFHNERYVGPDGSAGYGSSSSMAKKLYYAFRGFVPSPLRHAIKRLYSRGWEEHTFPEWPVDHSLDRLLQKLMVLQLEAQGVEEVPFIWFWPEGYPSCSIMTHDVETTVGRDFCSTLMDMNAAHGVKASFQLVPEQRYEVSEPFLAEIRRRGFEVNVHDLNHDGRLFWNRPQFLERVRKINEYARRFGAVGFRSGAMYRNTDWYQAFEISYDMSVPNVAHLDPQRGGCCTVMPFFLGKVLEMPLTTAQDYFLFNIFEDYSTALWRRQIDIILAQNGLMSFLVHPDYILTPETRAAYSELLAMIEQLHREGKTWMALPREVNAWWRQRQRMQLVRLNGRWTVQGPGSERARVAYAKAVNGQMAYRWSDSHAHEHTTLQPAQIR